MEISDRKNSEFHPSDSEYSNKLKNNQSSTSVTYSVNSPNSDLNPILENGEL